MFKRNLFIKIFIVLLVLAPTAAALAQTYQTPNIWPLGWWAPNGLVSCTGNYLSANTTGNAAGTCQNLCDLIDTAINIVYFAMSAAIFIIAPILFVVGGIILMISGANPEMLTMGKKTLTDTLIGLVIVLCSYLIVNTIITTLHIGGIGGFGGAMCSTPAAGTTTTNSTSVAAPAVTTPTTQAPTPTQGFTGYGGGGFGGAGAGGTY